MAYWCIIIKLMPGQTFELGDVILAAMTEKLAGVFTAIPGRVVSYNATEQSVDVQPLIQHGYINEVGDRVAERLPLVPRVPIVFPGGGGFRVTFPIAVGDSCLLVFANSSLDRWLQLGGEVDPADDHRHSLQDAIAIPGIRDFAHPLKAAPTDRMSVGSDDGGGGVSIEIHSNELRLGGDAANDPVVRKSDLNAFIQSDYNNHVHGILGIQTGSTNLLSDAPNSSASTPGCSPVVKSL